MIRLSIISRCFSLLVVMAIIAGCASAPAITSSPALKVLAVETFLADIAQNVAGDRVQVEALIPLGLDPHAFDPTPQDVARIAGSQALVINGAGFEEWLTETLQNAGRQGVVIEAAAGLSSRPAHADEETAAGDEAALHDEGHHHEGDPHFWLDPNNVIKYVENIRDGLSQVDPAGAETYTANAEAYIARLKELDRWIAEQVEPVPPDKRLLVTNHESLGYFADRYGFQVVGVIVPSVSTGASPSAQQFAHLTSAVKAAGAQAIFLETGSNRQLASQLAQETGINVVTELYTHSITDAAGAAPTYIEMIKYNVRAIVGALK